MQPLLCWLSVTVDIYIDLLFVLASDSEVHSLIVFIWTVQSFLKAHNHIHTFVHTQKHKRTHELCSFSCLLFAVWWDRIHKTHLDQRRMTKSREGGVGGGCKRMSLHPLRDRGIQSGRMQRVVVSLLVLQWAWTLQGTPVLPEAHILAQENFDLGQVSCSNISLIILFI